MTAFLTVAEALWPYLVIAAAITATGWLADRWAERKVAAMVSAALDAEATDLLDQMARDDWGRDLIGLEPVDPFATTRAQIAALETTKDIAS